MASADQVELAITSVVAGAPQMAALKAYERANILARLAAAMEKQREELALLMTLESGKPIKDARVEVDRAILSLSTSAAEATRIYGEVLPLDVMAASSDRFGITHRFPLGPVLGITPFNFPLNLVCHKLGPAIAAGDSILIKPAPKTPLSALALGRIAYESGIPGDGLAVILSDNETTQRMVEDERFKAVSFTGSDAVGWKIKTLAGKKRTILELGGNAGAIVDETADMDLAASRIAAGGFGYAGQSCISVQRVFVHESIFDEFATELITRVQNLTLGDPRDESTDIGPMITPDAVDRITSWVQEAVDGGAQLLCGDAANGSIFAPTVLSDPSPAAQVCRKEAFAPIVALFPFRDFDDAIASINDSNYGLQAGVFTRDLTRALSAFERLEVGGVIVNDVPTFRSDPMPYGGIKDSGFGREGVRYAIEELTELKLLVLRSGCQRVGTLLRVQLRQDRGRDANVGLANCHTQAGRCAEMLYRKGRSRNHAGVGAGWIDHGPPLETSANVLSTSPVVLTSASALFCRRTVNLPCEAVAKPPMRWTYGLCLVSDTADHYKVMATIARLPNPPLSLESRSVRGLVGGLFSTASFWAVCAYGAVFAGFLVARPLPHHQMVIGSDILDLIGPSVGLFLCWRGLAAPLWRMVSTRSLAQLASSHLILFQLFMGLGLVAYLAGTSQWDYFTVIAHQSPFPSSADFAYLSIIPCFLTAILLLPTAHTRGWARWRLVLDGVLITACAAILAWYFILGPTILASSAESLVKVIVGAVYPLQGILLLVCILAIWMRTTKVHGSEALLLISCGMVAYMVGDIVFDFQILHNIYQDGTLLDATWPSGLLMLSLGVLRLRRKLGADRASEDSRQNVVVLWHLLVSYLVLVPLIGLDLAVWWTGQADMLAVGVYVGTGLVFLVLLLRQLMAMFELRFTDTQNGQLIQDLEMLARTDGLTGLANRRHFGDVVQQTLRVSRSEAQPLALLLLDLDRFKLVNDTLGHGVGDELLVQVADRLKTAVRQTDTVARLGGDEFAVLLPGANPNAALRVATSIHAALLKPFPVAGRSIWVAASIGITCFPDHGYDQDTLLQRADVCMYEAKRKGRGTMLCHEELDGQDATELDLAGELHEAIERGEVTLQYQPMVGLISGEIMRVEALARWQHPRLGLLPPGRFIHLAEQTDSIIQLLIRALDQGLDQLVGWEAAGLLVNLSLNVSMRNLRDPSLSETIRTQLAAHNVAPSRLCLELTESVVMDDVEHTREAMQQLSAIGVRLSIDDFGTGYSSLAYLSTLPFDEIKIDRRFVQGMLNNQSQRAIVAATVGLGHALGMQVVTEGVEDELTLTTLRELGADAAQGFYLTPPLGPDDLQSWMREYRRAELRLAS
jgi:diguanylate cyclase (GGDEF)-like protein